MPEVFHVRPNLVRASRFQFAFHQRYIPEPLKHRIVGNRRATFFAFRKSHCNAAILWTPANIDIDGAFLRSWFAPDQGPVGSFNGMVKKLFGQFG